MTPTFAPALRFFVGALLALSGTTASHLAQAASFEVAIAPSRFEISGKSAQRVGQSLTIYNLGASASEVSVRTIDWTYSPDGQIGYVDELLPGSCRPWVTLERKALRIAANSKASFRFQIDVPDDAPRTECRFMLAIEGVEPATRALIQDGGASMSLPVSGRIAVAVYLAVNGAESKLEMKELAVRQVQGKPAPVVVVTNNGDAHGRLDGSLDAINGDRQEFELVPEGTPVMPGQTRTLALTVKREPGDKPVELVFPLKARGILDWEKGSFRVDAQFK
ncbi:MAG: hypothetical protein JWP79_2071 [Polaromonas sp.]|jgi:fimbrial chaperone protein|nr:hypothetical protein [Polaromonas sp.]MDB5844761.1 hypothetical protein [Polaromonas sp.]MDB5938642.1 hypothetical protein [Polaromonas sp.]